MVHRAVKGEEKRGVLGAVKKYGGAAAHQLTSGRKQRTSCQVMTSNM